MSKAFKVLQEGQALLRNEIIEFLKAGAKISECDETVYGYPINTLCVPNFVQETIIKDLILKDGELFAFMTASEDDEYDETQRKEILNANSEDFLPNWYCLDNCFYGLLLPTLMSIRNTLDEYKEMITYGIKKEDRVVWDNHKNKGILTVKAVFPRHALLVDGPEEILVPYDDLTPFDTGKN